MTIFSTSIRGRAALLATALLAVGSSLPNTARAQASNRASTPAPAAVQAGLRQFAQRASRESGLRDADVLNPLVTSQYTDAHNGVTHLYLRQRHQGVEVMGAVADVHLDRAGRLVGEHQNFVADLAGKLRTVPTAPSLAPVQAVAAAARAVGAPAPRNLRVLREGAPAAGLLLSNGGMSRVDIPVKLVYQPLADGALRLAWDVTFFPTRSAHYWNVRVDAQTGQLLDQTDYIISEPTPLALAAAPTAASAARPNAPAPVAGTAARSGVPNSYHVWPITIESPSHGARQVVTNATNAAPVTPNIGAPSPFGWHDTNGQTGPESTLTRGNNVAAYDDRADRDTSDLSFSPDGGPTLDFDFPYSATGTSIDNRSAAITNLFYWNNLVHDVMYRKGFHEFGGNFQVNNYDRGGAAQDAVQAEAQDGSGLNNANFGTPPDGSSPYMQMYLWSGGRPLTVTAPAAIAGQYNGSEAGWAANLELIGPLTAEVVAVADTAGNLLKGCVPYPTRLSVQGKIVLVKRGTCTFKAKALQAQLAGAAMLIIADTAAATAPIAPGNDATITTAITIPVLTVTQATGNILRTATGPVTITAAAVRRDGDFDNGIIAHEYGHGISNRLTGGPANAACLRNREQMGEGWSDFFGLWLTTKPTDVGTTPRGIGTFATFQPTTGGGIRTRPYTTNFAVNELTYANLGVAPYTAVHAVGTIWCSTLWDLNWALINRYAYNPDLYAATGGNNICLQLVLDGCKLQPCSPGFLDGRNAILKADSLNNKGANAALIWQVFARRGMGFSAKQGSSDLLTDQVAAFDLPSTLLANARALSREAQLETYPNPATDQLTVRAQIGRPTAILSLELVDLLGRSVLRQEVLAARLHKEGVAFNTAGLTPGVYVLRLRTPDGATVSRQVSVQH
ncbi:M36 family metallopeptidase [Hymenobacter sp.]|uniref:M36 family metallopeptidase n=1 Tax=Hymenobacter sp. TaxID=1898978 RepID=UPI00286A93D0|nr:M36 family metallopeptidase [Hymenobacter sp.]